MDFETSTRIANTLLSAKWIFAKTASRNNPHWYTLRKTWGGEEEFIESVLHIREEGYDLRWRDRRVYKCWNINEHRYWTMGCPVRPAELVTGLGDWKNETILINRAEHEVRPEADFDEIADKYDGMFDEPRDHREQDEISEMIGRMEGSVLDIGCGTGLAYEMCDMDKELYCGVDPSREMLSQFGKKHGEATTIASTYEDFHTVKRFDNIVSLFGSASYVDPEFFRKLRYQLSEGGQFFLMFYAEDYDPVAYDKVGAAMPYHGRGSGMFARCERYGDFAIVSGGREDLPE